MQIRASFEFFTWKNHSLTWIKEEKYYNKILIFPRLWDQVDILKNFSGLLVGGLYKSIENFNNTAIIYLAIFIGGG